MKLITKDIDGDIFDYLDINKTYKIKMVERPEKKKGLFGRYINLELWAEEVMD